MDRAAYSLEIYPPGNRQHPLVDYTSDIPFMAISIGDALHTSHWPEAGPDRYLRAVDVQHVFSGEVDQPRHRIMVYTEVEELD